MDTKSSLEIESLAVTVLGSINALDRSGQDYGFVHFNESSTCITLRRPDPALNRYVADIFTVGPTNESSDIFLLTLIPFVLSGDLEYISPSNPYLSSSVDEA